MMKIEEVEKIAKDVLKKTGQHGQQLMIEKKTGDKIEVVMAVLCYDEEKKEELLKMLRQWINNGSVDRYFFMTEAWKSEDIYSQPSKAKDKKEILIVCEFRRDNKNKAIYLEFERKRNMIVFTDRKVIDKDTGIAYSRFNFFLEDAMEEVVKKAKIDMSLKCVDDKMIKEVTKKAREFFKDDDITEDLMRRTITNMIKKGSIGFKKNEKVVYTDIEEDEIKNKKVEK